MKKTHIIAAIAITLASTITMIEAKNMTKPQHNIHHKVARSMKHININTASAAELSTLKGIGEKKALAIIKYREKNGAFNNIDELSHVKGIGLKMTEQIKNKNSNLLTNK